jgi:hypothetical protein
MKKMKEEPGRAEHRARQVRDAYLHLMGGRHDATSLAKSLGVSIATAARIIEALRAELRRKDMSLVSARSEDGFHYEIRAEAGAARLERDAFVRGVIRGGRGRRLKPEDLDVYGGD